MVKKETFYYYMNRLKQLIFLQSVGINSIDHPFYELIYYTTTVEDLADRIKDFGVFSDCFIEFALSHTYRILDYMTSLGIHAITVYDPEYPVNLYLLEFMGKW